MLRHITTREKRITLDMMERVKAVKRTSPERDLLCAPWRGRAVANSPTLRLDESTVNADSQKSKRGGKKWAMSNVRQGGKNKQNKPTSKPEMKTKQSWSQSKPNAAEAKG